MQEFNINEVIDKIKNLDIPYVSADKGCFSDNNTIMITISIDNKIDWPNGYLENSNYARFHFSISNMKLEKFSGSMPKMRKCKVKSGDHLISKLLEYTALHS